MSSVISSRSSRSTQSSTPSKPAADPNFLGKGTYGTVVVEGDLAVKYCCDSYNCIKEHLLGSALDHPSIIKHKEFSLIASSRSDCTNDIIRPWFDPNPIFPCKRERISVGVIKMKRYDMTLKQFAKRGGLTSDQYEYVIRKIMEGLQYLHANSIIHSDLKPDNILLSVNGRTIKELVLCDLGITNIVKYAEVELTADTYQDPNYKSTTYHDVYSMGVIITRIYDYSISPKNPPRGTPDNQKAAVRQRLNLEYLQEAIPRLPEPYRTLAKRMTSDDRPTIEQCMISLGYSIPKTKMIYRKLYLDDYPNPHICWTMTNIEDKINLGRARVGSYALREYLYRGGKINSRVLPEGRYLNALTIILQSLYRSSKLPLKNIECWYTTIDELIHDQQFIIHITTPSKYLRNGISEEWRQRNGNRGY